ncbi:hypothetical protein PTKIN_Ptkin05aG0145500 [Pterospermum kingtungense]
MQECAFRGHDEFMHSTNRGFFIELIKLQARANEESSKLVLENAPSNSKYTSSMIQKELLHILTNKVRNKIHKELGGELGGAKFCILVDEALNESNKEQMELFTLNSALSPIDGFKSVKIDDICTLARKFYAQDFTRIELDALRRQLKHYELIRLVLTLPISIATTERAFSTINLLKTRLHNKMDNDFLTDCMVICIEKDC